MRPRICPIFPPVIIRDAITRVYSVMAVWMPVTVVPTSSATVAIDTFMTELSSVMRNWADASVTRTVVAAAAATWAAGAGLALSTAASSRSARDDAARWSSRTSRCWVGSLGRARRTAVIATYPAPGAGAGASPAAEDDGQALDGRHSPSLAVTPGGRARRWIHPP